MAVLTMTFITSCASSLAQDGEFERIAEKYIEGFLRMNPEAATSLGDHRYDDRLDDYSKQGFLDALKFNQKILADLEDVNVKQLSVANHIDYMILRNQVEGTIFRVQELREYEWNPLIYNVGGAIYYLIARDFAPLEQRMQSVKNRLARVPEVAALAKANLKNPPKVHTETAIQQNKGTMSLIQNQLDTFVADMSDEFKREFEPIRKQAVDALEYYGSWLEKDLLPESNGEFRIGEKKFRKKLAHVLDADFTMEEILERAQADLVATQDAMYETALPLYEKYFDPEGAVAIPGDRKDVIKSVLDKLAEVSPNNDTIVDDARKCLTECEAFAKKHKLVTVPDEPIELIVMPEFQRGVAVAYCDSPGPLEPAGKTFYAISPTPEDWTEERAQSFFREYNNYMLHDLTIHEAVPGHYLQLAHSNRFKAPTMIRSIFYSGPFVEGWAVYSEQLMAEMGYGGPEVKMQQLKMRLRVVINAIIDQKIHTAGMTEQEAMDLMLNQGFQEEGEAAGKWRRACLTSTQLSTYFVGSIEINEIRRLYEAKHGKQKTLQAMHDQMLSFGSPPPRHVKGLLGL
jgi:uncharacterized protein (DUF885 family)